MEGRSALLLLLLLLPGDAGIVKLKSKSLVSGTELAWRFGAVTVKDEPAISFIYAPAELELYPNSGIASQLTFRSGADVVAQKPVIHVAIYHSQEAFYLGITKMGRKHMCCTEELSREKLCDKVGELFKAAKVEADPNNFKLYPIVLNATVVNFKEDLKIVKTGVYYYFVANCKNVNTVVDGKIVFLNPFGFLGVTEFPSLVFYSVATWVYVFSVMMWFLLCVVHYKDIFFLQVFIGVLFLVGFAEMAIWYGEYTFSNVTGATSLFLVVTGVLTSTIKKTLSRTLVLVTSMGLGIIVAKLDTITRVKIVILTLLYAICSGCLDMFQVLERTEASGQRLSLLFLLGVSILDTIFYYWTFLSLSIILKQLSTRRTKVALAKMQLYKTLWWILLSVVVFTVSLIVSQVVLVTSLDSDSTWLVLWWLRFAFWDIGYYLVLIAIAFLFRPMDNNQRFALIDEEGNELESMIGKEASEIATLPLGVEIILEDAGESEKARREGKAD